MVSMLHEDNGLFEKMLPVIYHYLPPVSELPPYPLVEGSGEPGPAFQVAFTLLLTGVTIEQTQKVYDSLKSHWDGIWQWCRLLIEGCMVNRDMDPEVRLKHHFLTMGLLANLTRDSGTARVIGSTPGLIPLVVRVWSIEKKWLRQNMPNSPESAAVVLRNIFSADPISFKAESMFTAGLGQSFDKISAKFVNRVAHAIASASIPVRDLQADITLMWHCGQDLTFRRSLLAANSASILARTMSRLTSHAKPYDTYNASAAETTLSWCIHSLCRTFSDEGAPRIAHALEDRMLLSMFKVGNTEATDQDGQTYPDVDLNAVYRNALSTITPHLAYRNVLRYAVKSLKTIKAMELEEALESVIPPTSSFWKTWHAFENHVAGRLACKIATAEEFALSRKFDIPCGNPTVPIFTRWYNIVSEAD